MRRAAVFLALSALLAAPAAAQEAIVLSPAGPWEDTSAGDKCRVERNFEANGQPHLLILEQNAPGPGLGMAIAGPTLIGLEAGRPMSLAVSEPGPQMEVRARIEPNQQFGKVAITFFSTYTSADGKPVARLDAAAMGDMDRVTITQGDTHVTFATGPLGEAVPLLNACTAKMLRSWGLDPEEQYGLKHAATGEGVNIDYPRMAARNLRSGPVEAVVTIDATGAATDCRIIASSGYEELDTATCKAMKKARFSPAIDAAGKPAPSFWVTRVTFAATAFEAERKKR